MWCKYQTDTNRLTVLEVFECYIVITAIVAAVVAAAATKTHHVHFNAVTEPKQLQKNPIHRVE